MTTALSAARHRRERERPINILAHAAIVDRAHAHVLRIRVTELARRRVVNREHAARRSCSIGRSFGVSRDERVEGNMRVLQQAVSSLQSCVRPHRLRNADVGRLRQLANRVRYAFGPPRVAEVRAFEGGRDAGERVRSKLHDRFRS